MLKLNLQVLKKFQPTLRLFRRNEDGMAAIEMAFIFPVMVLLFFGVINIGKGLEASRKINMASAAMADLVTQEPGTTTARLNAIMQASYQIVRPLQADGIRIELFQFTHDNNGNVTLGWTHKNPVEKDSSGNPVPGSPGSAAPARCGNPPTVGQVQSLISATGDLIVARVCTDYNWIASYKYEADYKFDRMVDIRLNEELTFQPRNITLPCADC